MNCGLWFPRYYHITSQLQMNHLFERVKKHLQSRKYCIIASRTPEINAIMGTLVAICQSLYLISLFFKPNSCFMLAGADGSKARLRLRLSHRNLEETMQKCLLCSLPTYHPCQWTTHFHPTCPYINAFFLLLTVIAQYDNLFIREPPKV